MGGKYIFPYDSISKEIRFKVQQNVIKYIEQCFENSEEANLQEFYKEEYACNSVKEIIDKIAENEKFDFDERFDRALNEFLINKELYHITPNRLSSNPTIPVESLTYFWEKDKVFFETVLTNKSVEEIVDKKFDIQKIKKLKNNKAYIVLLIDNSSSVGVWEKRMVKSFTYWFNRILNRFYDTIEFRFIVYNTTAYTTNEKEFFYQGVSGGTILSSGLYAVKELLQEEDISNRDTYVIQFSDGDNLTSDNIKCKYLVEDIMNEIGNFSYVELNQYNRHTTLWDLFSRMKEVNKFCIKTANDLLSSIVLFLNSHFHLKDRIRVQIKE